MPEPVFDNSKPVTVTGATGYVAGWIIKRLLAEGYTVHATVRDPSNSARTAHLTALSDELPGSIRFFRAELDDPAGFDEAIQGVATVIHTASPFTVSVKDPQRDLIDPAVNGTRNVLSAVNRCDDVERVVVTSSLAAIYSDNSDCARAPGGKLTEENWNRTSSLAHNPYSFSKTLAEKAAWEMFQAQDRWKLAVVNPGFVLGPGLAPRQTSESFNLIRRLSDASFRTGVPHPAFGLVDLRHVADAHIRAAFLPEASGRNITFAESGSLMDIANMIRAKYGDGVPLPRRELPKWLVWLIGPLADRSLSRRYVSENVGHPFRAENSKSIRDLGVTYGPVSKAVTDMFQAMKDTGEIAVG